jgi:general secretion pathway protein C
MGFDAKLKRFFPLVLVTLIGLVAFFQSAGLGQLVATTVMGEPTAPADKPPPASVLAQPASQKKSGEPILARNIFDSITGPLTGTEMGGGDIPLPTPEPAPGGPVAEEDPPCGFGRVLLIAASDDPQWSFARIEADGGGAQLRRIGDDIGGHTLQAVGWNRVWLSNGGARCQMKLGEKRAGAPSKGGAKPDDSKRAPARGGRRGRELSPEMAAKINKVSDTEFNIERSLVNEILENQAELMKTARIVPEKDGDKAGIRLFGIRPNSLLDHLGMKNGDRLESINGFDMSDPQKALEAYARLAQAEKLKVQLNRKGAPTAIEYNIQ